MYSIATFLSLTLILYWYLFHIGEKNHQKGLIYWKKWNQNFNTVLIIVVILMIPCNVCADIYNFKSPSYIAKKCPIPISTQH